MPVFDILFCILQLMCCNEDLKELEIGMGPRKKLSSFIAQENEKRQLAKERKAKEAAERLEQERKAAVKETTDAVTSTHSMTKVFGVKIIQGLAGTGQTFVDYPQLLFHPQHLFALGSPIGLFLTVRLAMIVLCESVHCYWYSLLQIKLILTVCYLFLGLLSSDSNEHVRRG